MPNPLLDPIGRGLDAPSRMMREPTSLPPLLRLLLDPLGAASGEAPLSPVTPSVGGSVDETRRYQEHLRMMRLSEYLAEGFPQRFGVGGARLSRSLNSRPRESGSGREWYPPTEPMTQRRADLMGDPAEPRVTVAPGEDPPLILGGDEVDWGPLIEGARLYEQGELNPYAYPPSAPGIGGIRGKEHDLNYKMRSQPPLLESLLEPSGPPTHVLVKDDMIAGVHINHPGPARGLRGDGWTEVEYDPIKHGAIEHGGFER